MKKIFQHKNITVLVLTLVFALIISIGLSYAAKVTWFEPSSLAPANNFSTPITADQKDQIKTGSLSTGGLIAYQNAQFDMRSFLTGTVFGGVKQGLPNAKVAPLYIGGTDTQVDPTTDGPADYEVTTNITGSVKANGGLGSEGLITDKRFRLCANDQGKIVFCPNNGEYHAPNPTYPLFVVHDNTGDNVTVTITGGATANGQTVFNCPSGTDKEGCMFENVFNNNYPYSMEVTWTSPGRPRGSPGLISIPTYSRQLGFCGECNSLSVDSANIDGEVDVEIGI